MATEVLNATVRDKAISRHVHHDLESFIWVIFYAIYKHTVLDPSLGSTFRAKVAQEFKDYFGGGTLREILLHRGTAQSEQPELRACHPTEGVLNFLLLRCSRMLYDQNPPNPVTAQLPKAYQDKYASRVANPQPVLVKKTEITYEHMETMLQVALEVLLGV
jgi:hypothetical protein